MLGDQPALNIRAELFAQPQKQASSRPVRNTYRLLSHAPAIPELHCRPTSHKRRDCPPRGPRYLHASCARAISSLPRATASRGPAPTLAFSPCPCRQPYDNLFLLSIASLLFLGPGEIICSFAVVARQLDQAARKPIVAPGIFRRWDGGNKTRGGCAAGSGETLLRDVVAALGVSLSRASHRSNRLMRLWSATLGTFLHGWLRGPSRQSDLWGSSWADDGAAPPKTSRSKISFSGPFSDAPHHH